MRNAMRILTVALTVVMMVSAFIAPASATVAVDSLANYGQKTFEIVKAETAPNVTDGIVDEGEYGEAVATYKPGDADVSVSNWTGSNPLTDDQLLEIAPEQLTMYATWDDEYLYCALVVVKADHHSVTPQLNGWFWGTENWTIRFYMDAYAADRDEGDVFTYSEAVSESFCVCAGLTKVSDAPQAPLAVIGENCSYQMYNAWDPTEGYGATRNNETQTTTYEFKAAWANIWGDGEVGDVPSYIPFIGQYVLSDSRYLANVEPGYVTAVGSLRWCSRLDAETAQEAGIGDGTAAKNVPHILKLVTPEAPETTVEETTVVDETTAEETTVVDETTAVETTVVDETTAAVTDATTNAPATTTAAAAEEGCASVIGFGAIAVITAAAAVVALKKKD